MAVISWDRDVCVIFTDDVGICRHRFGGQVLPNLKYREVYTMEQPRRLESTALIGWADERTVRFLSSI